MEPTVSFEKAAPPTEKREVHQMASPASQLLHCAAFYARCCTLYRRRTGQREIQKGPLGQNRAGCESANCALNFHVFPPSNKSPHRFTVAYQAPLLGQAPASPVSSQHLVPRAAGSCRLEIALSWLC